MYLSDFKNVLITISGQLVFVILKSLLNLEIAAFDPNRHIYRMLKKSTAFINLIRIYIKTNIR